jgi:hypothetical protein
MINSTDEARMRQFSWRERNRHSIESQALSRPDVEAAFDRVYQLNERPDGSYEMLAEIPSGQQIRVVWRFESEDAPKPQVSLARWGRR